ncbi:MAG TPA: hypothetical protein VL463_28385 [Kofleriaceae bacterium]|nr:hypothetical protein [Kofleriaceae bacterium]
MDDENLSRTDRELAAGVVIYIVTKKDIKDRNDSVGSFADDALLLRLALRRIGEKNDEDAAAFRDRFPELFGELSAEVDTCKTVLGDLMGWLEAKVDGLRKLEHRSKKIAAYLDDEEARSELYDDGLAFRTDYPIDDSTINDKLKKASTVTDVIKRRRAEDSPRV